MGNTITEILNGHTIESKYSEDFALGHRTEIHSSLGLNMDLNLNKFGQTEGINADFGDQAKYQSQLSYNALGQVLERTINTVNGGIIKDCWNYAPQGRQCIQNLFNIIKYRHFMYVSYHVGVGKEL